MNNKIVTILEGSVAQGQWGNLQHAYRKLTKEKTAVMPLQSFLIQDTKEPTHWKIVTVWKNMGSLQKMRNSGEVPVGLRIFREASCEPALSILTVAEEL